MFIFKENHMPTTILRFEKIKSNTNIHKAGAHHHRFSDTPNADPDLYHKNEILIGSFNTMKDVTKLTDHYKIKTRKNSVLAMDALLTLSPEILNTKQDTEAFKASAIEWLKHNFGKRCVNAVLHLDEKTPHIHAIIVPLDKNKSGRIRLNARELFNPLKLSEYQRTFNAHMQLSFPKIIPPQHGNKVRHNKIRAFYEELEKDSLLLKEKQLRIYEIELKKQQKSLIKKFLERFIPKLNNWSKKLEDDLREDIGVYATELGNKYRDRTKTLQFELEEVFGQDSELIELKNNLEKN
jgi:hypothetical protein